MKTRLFSRKPFVAKLCEQTDILYGKPLYSTIANVANEVFCKTAGDYGRSSTPLTAGNVREMLRGRVERIRPSFGEELERMKKDALIARRYLASVKKLVSSK